MGKRIRNIDEVTHERKLLEEYFDYIKDLIKRETERGISVNCLILLGSMLSSLKEELDEITEACAFVELMEALGYKGEEEK